MNVLHRTLRPFVALVAVLVGIYAATLPSAADEPPPASWRLPQQRTVVLVALDGVRWQDVFQGVDGKLAERKRVPRSEVVTARELVPALHRLSMIEGAAIGAPGRGPPMVASGPNFVSLPGYTELFTGFGDGRCANNHCPRTTRPTLADDIVLRTANPADAVVLASWEGIDRAAAFDPSKVTISVGRTTGVTRRRIGTNPRLGEMLTSAEYVDGEPGVGDFRPDRYTAAIALEYLESHRPRFLFLGLGDTDEYGHDNDYRSYLRALRSADETIDAVWRVVQGMNAGGWPATLFVTTDHGRSHDFAHHGRAHPESSRVWLVAAGADIAPRGLVASPVGRCLADVNATIRKLLSLPPLGASAAGQPIAEML